MVTWKNTLETEAEVLRNSSKEAAESAKTLKSENDTLKISNKKLADELVEHDLEKYSNRIKDKASVREQLLSNRDATIKTLEAIEVPVEKTPRPAERLHNSANGNSPKDALTNNEHRFTQQDAKRISNRAREMQKTLGISHGQAFELAKAEIAKAE